MESLGHFVCLVLTWRREYERERCLEESNKGVCFSSLLTIVRKVVLTTATEPVNSCGGFLNELITIQKSEETSQVDCFTNFFALL